MSKKVKSRKIKYLLSMIVISILITFFGMSKIEAYYQKSVTKNTSFTTKSYAAPTITLDKSVYPSGNNSAVINMTINNSNSYVISYTLSFSNSSVTYQVDGASLATYTVSANSSKTNQIVIIGLTGTSITATISVQNPYQVTYTKVINFDNTVPSCTFGNIEAIATGETGTLELTCTDSSGISTSTLTSSAFTLSNSNVSIQSITESSVTNGRKYTLTLLGNTAGSTNIALKASQVLDNNGNSNASVTKEVIVENREYIVTYNANGGTFAGNATTNQVTYKIDKGDVTKYSHTSNIDDAGVQNGNYENNLATKDVITIPGASSVHVVITTQLYASSDKVYVFSGEYTGSIESSTTGYLNRYTNTSKTTAEFDVTGDTVTFGMYSNTSGVSYGYYAVVTGEGNVAIATSGTYVEPTNSNSNYIFKGWCIDSNCTDGNEFDHATLSNDKIVYAKWSLKSATFVYGQEFNIKLKKLAGQSNATYTTVDTSITSLVRSNTLSITPTGDNLVSTSISDFPIYAWYDNGIIYYYSEAVTIYLNQEPSYMFYEMRMLSTADLSNINTSKATRMYSMFYYTGNDAATFNLNLSNWDTSKVTTMYYMFYKAGYSAGTWNIGNISNWDTSSLTSMHYMFNYAGYTADSFNLDLSNWNTSKVTTTYYMFYYAGYSATTWNIGDLSSWNVSSVKNMSHMFSSAGYSATTWDIGNISNWDTSNVTEMDYVFLNAGACALTWNVGNLSNWNTSKATTMKAMFENAGYNSGSFVLDLSNWSTSNVKDMSNMFYNAGYNAEIWNIGNLSNWNTSSVTTMSYMFRGTGGIATTWNIGDLSSWNTSSVTSMSSMFNHAGEFSTSNWSIGNLENWDVSNVTTMSEMFRDAGYNSSSWNIGNLSNWNTSSVTTMSYMFYETGYSASSFILQGLSSWNTSSVVNMSYMFDASGHNATTWSIGNLSNWNTSSLTNANCMFCSAGYNATVWDIGSLSGWDTTKLTNMSNMFLSAGSNATTVNSIGTLKIYATSISNMFNGANKLNGTLNIYSNPTSYVAAFKDAATSGPGIVVNYSSTTTNIDAIIATKSSTSNVTKGVQLD